MQPVFFGKELAGGVIGLQQGGRRAVSRDRVDGEVKPLGIQFAAAATTGGLQRQIGQHISNRAVQRGKGLADRGVKIVIEAVIVLSRNVAGQQLGNVIRSRRGGRNPNISQGRRAAGHRAKRQSEVKGRIRGMGTAVSDRAARRRDKADFTTRIGVVRVVGHFFPTAVAPPQREGILGVGGQVGAQPGPQQPVIFGSELAGSGVGLEQGGRGAIRRYRINVQTKGLRAEFPAATAAVGLDRQVGHGISPRIAQGGKSLARAAIPIVIKTVVVLVAGYGERKRNIIRSGSGGRGADVGQADCGGGREPGGQGQGG